MFKGSYSLKIPPVNKQLPFGINAQDAIYGNCSGAVNTLFSFVFRLYTNSKSVWSLKKYKIGVSYV
jgi:hypothetical protein